MNTKIHGFFSQELIENSVSKPYRQLIFREYLQLLGGSIEINGQINVWKFLKQIGRSVLSLNFASMQLSNFGFLAVVEEGAYWKRSLICERFGDELNQ
jgi:hypothetical protein